MVEGKKNLPGETEAMKLEDGFDALDALVVYLSQSEEWAYIQRHDVLIQKAEADLYRKLDQLKAASGVDCALELEDDISVYSSRHDDAAILFGMRMAVKLFYAFGRPMEMSRYLSRDAEKGAGIFGMRIV